MRAVEVMTLRELQDTLRTLQRVLDQERRWRERAYRLLWKIGMEVAGEVFDEWRKQGRRLEEMSDEDILQAIRSGLASRSAWQAESPIRDDEEKQRLRRQVRALQEQVQDLLAQLERHRDTRTKDVSPNPENRSAKKMAWQQRRSFERDSKVLKVLGDTGFFTPSDLLPLTGLPRSSFYRALESLEQLGLVVRKEGRVWLSPQGREAYAELTGRDPKPGYPFLLREHKHDDHIRLILRAAREFERLGYEVDLIPRLFRFPDGHLFIPDFIAVRGDERCYIEAETGLSYRFKPEKWANAARAGQGTIWLVTPSVGVLNRIQSDIGMWASTEGVGVVLWATHLEYLQKTQDSPWFRHKRFLFGPMWESETETGE